MDGPLHSSCPLALAEPPETRGQRWVGTGWDFRSGDRFAASADMSLRRHHRAGKSSLGDAKSSLGGAKSSLGDAKSSLGDTKSSLGDVYRPHARERTTSSAHRPPHNTRDPQHCPCLWTAGARFCRHPHPLPSSSRSHRHKHSCRRRPPRRAWRRRRRKPPPPPPPPPSPIPALVRTASCSLPTTGGRSASAPSTGFTPTRCVPIGPAAERLY
jgi:hypothetical protein